MWRQYNKYCPKAGVNLRCNGTKCRKYRCGYDKDIDMKLTYQDMIADDDENLKLKCSRKLKTRWMKWLSPDDDLCETKFGTPIFPARCGGGCGRGRRN